MNPICKIWAHKYDENDPKSPLGVMTCERCKTVTNWNVDEDRGTWNLAWLVWKFTTAISGWIMPRTRYFQKCHDCGKRWGKHTSDCTPF